MVSGARRHFRGSIAAKILALAAVLILLLVGISMYALQESKDTLRESVTENVKLQARSVMDRIDNEIFSRLHEMSQAAVDPYLLETVAASNSEFDAMEDPWGYVSEVDSEWTDTPTEELTPLMLSIMNTTTSMELKARYIDHYREDHGVDAWGRVSVMNRFGAVVAMTQRTDDYNQSDEDWWQTTMLKDLYVEEVAYDAHSGFYAQRVCAAILDDSGVFIGEIVGFANTIEIARVAVTRGSAFESTRVIITDSGGALIFSSDAYVFREDRSMSSYFTGAVDHEGSLITRDMNREVLYGYARSNGYLSYEGHDWGMFIGYDLAEIFAPANDLLTRIQLFSSAAVLVGVILALVLARTITRPIVEFKRASKKISDGKLDTRVPVISGDEVGDLANTFNTMVDKLERSYEGLEDKVRQRTLELARLNQALTDEAAERKRYAEALELANKKLRFLGHLTRHDIKNQLTVMRGWLTMAREEPDEKTLTEMISKTDRAAQTIGALLDFTGEYERIGLAEPRWLDAAQMFREGIMGLDTQRLKLSLKLEGLEILTDPMFSKVFRNLTDNTLRHAEKATTISASYEIRPGGLAVVYADDGIGITGETRKKLFQRGAGRNTGLGLYLTKEMLTASGITITETGTPDRGARFEIFIPNGKFRLR